MERRPRSRSGRSRPLNRSHRPHTIPRLQLQTPSRTASPPMNINHLRLRRLPQIRNLAFKHADMLLLILYNLPQIIHAPLLGLQFRTRALEFPIRRFGFATSLSPLPRSRAPFFAFRLFWHRGKLGGGEPWFGYESPWVRYLRGSRGMVDGIPRPCGPQTCPASPVCLSWHVVCCDPGRDPREAT